MTDTIKPPLRESLEVVYEDERRETIIVKRLSNTDMIKWADTGLDKAFLVLRSVEFSSAGVPPANQSWFDSLTQDSAFAVVEEDVYRDAAVAARMPPDLKDDELRPVVKTDAAGRQITTFVGRRSFIHGLKRDPQYVKAFNFAQQTRTA